MELHQIKYVLAVVRTGNFSRAAATCNVSQPSITRAIRQLESELGGPLFDRRPNGAFLTQLGRTLLPRLESAHAELQAATEEASKLRVERSQRLRVGLMCTIGPRHLVDLLHTVQKRVPDLDLRIEEDRAHDVIERLIADEFDVAIACLPTFPDEIAVKPLFSELYAVAFPAGHRFEAMAEVPLSELAGESYLERLHCEFDDYYAAHFGNQPFDMNVRFASEREDWIQAMVLAELGIAIVPQHLPLMSGIMIRPLTQPEMRRQISQLTVRGRPHVPALEAFSRATSAVKWSAIS